MQKRELPHGENLVPQKARPRDTPTPKGRTYLTERDRAILYDIFVHGAMRRDQIQARHFQSVPRCNSRLASLFHAGYLERTFLPVSARPEVAYGTQIVYRLASKGVPLVAQTLGWEVSRVRERQRNGTPTYLTHTLEIVDFYLGLEAAIAGEEAWSLVRFVPELLARHEYEVRASGGEWRLEVFKPDAVFLLERAGDIYAYSLEIDLGHTSQRELSLKAQIHARYAATGLFHKRYDIASFTTLFVTTTETRKNNLLSLLHERPACWATTFAAIKEKSALESVWHTVSGAKRFGEEATR